MTDPFFECMNNHKFGAIYQSIRDACDGSTPLGDPDVPYFEHLLKWLESLRKVYQRTAD